MNHSEFVWIAAAVVGIFSIARTARLLICDDFPPVEWAAGHVSSPGSRGQPWRQARSTCPFCLAPYLAAGMVVWAWLSDLNTAWWIINGWWAASPTWRRSSSSYDQPE